jgi:hypothetical protein
MKLESRGTEVEIYGAETEEATFAIATSAIAFQTLSSKLYSDVTTAIIRELACNAYDAHVMVGHKNKPFDLNLPTAFNPEFVIRDYGPGMSDEHILSLYCTYFSSSKQDTNKQIGGFGIGSKSPFSYTDGFTVISYQGGEKRTYSAYVNENKIPAVVRLSTETTGEPDGLEVKFPVQVQDAAEFEKKSRAVFEFFDPLPNINRQDFVVRKAEYSLSGKNWKLRKNADYLNGIRIIQGMVPYKVEGFQGLALEDKEKAVLQLPLDIFLPIGTLSPAATRESLTNDKDTVAKTRKILLAIYDDLTAHIEEGLTQYTSGWDKLDHLRKFADYPTLKNLVLAVRKKVVDDPSLFRVRRVSQIDYPLISISTYTKNWNGVSSRPLFESRYGNMMQLNLLDDKSPFWKEQKYVIVDRSWGGHKDVEHNCRQGKNNNEIVAIKPAIPEVDPLKFDMQAYLDQAQLFLTDIGAKEFEMLSDMEKAPKPVKVTGSAPVVAVKSVVFSNHVYNWSGMWHRTANVLPDTGTHFYVTGVQGKPQGFSNTLSSIDFKRFVERVKELAFIDIKPADDLYYFTPAQGPPKKTKAVWIDLVKHVEEKCLEYVNDPANKYIVYEDEYILRNTCCLSSNFDDEKFTKRLAPYSLYLKACNQLQEIKSASRYIPDSIRITLCELKSSEALKLLPGLQITDKISMRSMVRELKATYPLLDRVSAPDDLAVFYINSVDNQLDLDQIWITYYS